MADVISRSATHPLAKQVKNAMLIAGSLSIMTRVLKQVRVTRNNLLGSLFLGWLSGCQPCLWLLTRSSND
jgi:hypothetical protein